MLIPLSGSNTTAMPEIHTDVLIVGAGVTGLTLTTLLRQHGIQTHTIARHSGTSPSPRAHVTNQRTMEVFRDMGIEDRVLAMSTPLPDLGNGVVATTLTGMEIGRYSCYGAGSAQLSDFAMASPCKMVNCPQHLLEPILLTRTCEVGGSVRFYHELRHVEETAGGIMARVHERISGSEYVVRAKYIVGADGARSVVAKSMGFGFEGKPGLMSMLSCWLEVDLTPYTAYRPAGIYRLCKPGNEYWVGSGLLVNVRPFDEWILNRQYDPADGEPDTTPEAIATYAIEALGLQDDPTPIRVKHVAKWQVNHVVATEYRHGRVFIAGDAAHRHPPASGLGSNTCVQDAYNLSWKLALALKQKAGDQLLDSYNQERQPIGKQIVDHAIQTLYDMTELPQVLGFQKGQTSEQGYASLEALFSDVEGAEERRAKLDEQIKLGNPRSNALGLHLGHRYATSNAVVSDGSPFPPLTRDPVLHYEPTTHPGAYLPHAWIERNKRKISTLDMFELGSFGLVVGIGGKRWEEAAGEVSKKLGVELPVYKVGFRCPYDDVLGEWRDIREIGDQGVLLVRPDRHIAWRSFVYPDNYVGVLEEAFSTVLGQ